MRYRERGGVETTYWSEDYQKKYAYHDALSFVIRGKAPGDCTQTK